MSGNHEMYKVSWAMQGFSQLLVLNYLYTHELKYCICVIDSLSVPNLARGAKEDARYEQIKIPSLLAWSE